MIFRDPHFGAQVIEVHPHGLGVLRRHRGDETLWQRARKGFDDDIARPDVCKIVVVRPAPNLNALLRLLRLLRIEARAKALKRIEFIDPEPNRERVFQCELAR